MEALEHNPLGEYLLQKGIEQGLEQGIEQGIEQGLEQGERKAQIKIAKRLLLAGTPPQEICELTELPLEEIQRLEEELQQP